MPALKWINNLAVLGFVLFLAGEHLTETEKHVLVDSPFRLLHSLLCRVFILLFNSQERWLLPVIEELY